VRVEPSLGVSATQCSGFGSDTALYLQIDTTRPYADFNENGRNDACDIDLNRLLDCNQNGVLDSCEGAGGGDDCNANGRIDTCDVVGEFGLFDYDKDNLIDTCEIAANPSLDCNSNARLDSCDIGQFGEQDKNGDGRPDNCEFARGDFDLDGQVGAADLSGLLAIWGLQNPPYGDFNGDGIVGGADMSFILANWGPVEY